MEPQSIIDELTRNGMEFAVRFVPYSQAEPQQGADGDRWECFNWRARITYRGRTIATDYRQGTGILPDRIKLALKNAGMKWDRHTTDSRRLMNNLLEHGRPYGDSVNAVLPGPSALDVLASLVSDGCAALDVADFEEFARDMGYSEDSRSAERTYRQCVRIGLKLRAMFGADLDTMREAFAEL